MRIRSTGRTLRGIAGIAGAALALALLAAPVAATPMVSQIFLDRGVEVVDDGAADYFMTFAIVADADNVSVDVNSPGASCASNYVLPELFTNFWFLSVGGFSTEAARNSCFPSGASGDEYTLNLSDTDGPLSVDLDFTAPATPDGSLDVFQVDDITPANMAVGVSQEPSFEWTQSTCTNCRATCPSGSFTTSMLNLRIFDAEGTLLGATDKDQTATTHQLSGITPLDLETTYKFAVRMFNRTIVSGGGCNSNVTYAMTSSKVDSITFTTIPEPAVALLTGAGLAALAARRRRR